MEVYNFNEKFTFLRIGGNDEKYKNFQSRDKKCHFLKDFSGMWKYFLIDRSNLTRFSEKRSLSDQNYMLKKFWILKITEKNDLLKTVGACAE